MDLVYTSNVTLTKSSTNIPGISDHAIIVTDMDTKPYYQKNHPTEKLHMKESKLSKNIRRSRTSG
jgi:hypothetical protein